MYLKEFAKVGDLVFNITKIKFMHYFPSTCDLVILFEGDSEASTFYNISNDEYAEFEKQVMNNHKIILNSMYGKFNGEEKE